MSRVAFVVPSEIVDLVGNRQIHKVVVGWVKLDRIDTHAVAVKSTQLWAMAIGLMGLLKSLVQPSQMSDMRKMPGMTGPTHVRCPVSQRTVICPQVLIAHVGRHVDNLMGRQVRNRIAWCHYVSPCSETRCPNHPAANPIS